MLTSARPQVCQHFADKLLVVLDKECELIDKLIDDGVVTLCKHVDQPLSKLQASHSTVAAKSKELLESTDFDQGGFYDLSKSPGAKELNVCWDHF